MSRARSQVFVVGNRAKVRLELEQLIGTQEDMTFAGQARADNPGRALEAVAAEAPDVVVVDLAGSDRRTIGLIRRIRQTLPATAVLVITANSGTFRAVESSGQEDLRQVSGRDGNAEIVAAIRRLVAGDTYVSQQLSPMALERLLRANAGDAVGSLVRLTDRELQVFTLIGEGLRTREIAEELGLSIKTIEAHRGHIRRKLKLRRSQALHPLAARWMLGQVRD